MRLIDHWTYNLDSGSVVCVLTTHIKLMKITVRKKIKKKWSDLLKRVHSFPSLHLGAHLIKGLEGKPQQAGMTLIGVLAAASIGAIVVMGLTQLSTNIMDTVRKSQQGFHVIELAEEIKRDFEQSGSCTKSLDWYDNTKGRPDQGFEIRNSSGNTLYKAGQIIKGIRIREMKFKVRDGRTGVATVDRDGDGTVDPVLDLKRDPLALVYLALSDDPKDAMSVIPPLQFDVRVRSYRSGGKIRQCDIIGGTIAGGGGGSTPCYKVEGDKALVGCGGTIDNQDTQQTAFGASAGSNNSTGTENSFFGFSAGKVNASGKRNTFVGHSAGQSNISSQSNTFVGARAGKETTGRHNTFVGDIAGQNVTTGNDNTFVGAFSGRRVTTGTSNIFIGSNSGNQATTGSHNILLDGNIITGSDNILIKGANNIAGISSTADHQLNIGNLIMGYLPASASSTLNIPSGQGVLVNGSLDVHRKTILHQGLEVKGGDLQIHGNFLDAGGAQIMSLPASSRVYKKNIKPFKDFEKSLKIILSAPLFTYQYKKNYPDKGRMGIISEELPKELQIKDKGAPSRPDWASVYGTLWAGIKALAERLQSFQEKTATDFAKLKTDIQSVVSDFTARFKEIEARVTKLSKSVETQITALKLEWQIQMKDFKQETRSKFTALTEGITKLQAGLESSVQTGERNTRELAGLKKQLGETQSALEKSREELQKTQGELRDTQKQLEFLQKRMDRALPPASNR